MAAVHGGIEIALQHLFLVLGNNSFPDSQRPDYVQSSQNEKLLGQVLRGIDACVWLHHQLVVLLFGYQQNGVA